MLQTLSYADAVVLPENETFLTHVSNVILFIIKCSVRVHSMESLNVICTPLA